jgi:hypothetical protein
MRKHPQDLVLLKDLVSKKESMVGTTIFALAMHWGFPRDRLRLQAMQRYTGAKVITVSENCAAYSLPHLEINFNCRRGIQALARSVAIEVKHGCRVVLLLDYFWCAAGYYRERYGLHWLQDSSILLHAGASEIILPYDKGTGSDGMYAMLSGNIHQDICCSFIAPCDNVLWQATNLPGIDALVGALDKCETTNSLQTTSYLHEKTPFVLVTLKDGCGTNS